MTVPRLWALKQRLGELEAAGLYRRAYPLRPLDGVRAEYRGRPCVVFCSNDYLGLAQDPRLVEALSAAAREYGVGSGGAHLISGHRPEHEALEEELADFLGRERVLLFSTGYMANMGVIDALLERGEAAFQDRLNHASLLDGAHMAGAELIRYRHADVADLRERIANDRPRRRLIVTDGLFSMDGDLAPLRELVDCAAEHEALLVVDDAHGVGVIGPGGAGTVAASGLDQSQVPVLIGTLGKALGTFGAFAAGSAELIEYLLQRARTYVFTTAPPPALAAASRKALALAREETWRRNHLHALITRFRRGAQQLGLPLLRSATPIQPLLVGSPDATLRISQALLERGILVTAIRPPTVPPGSSRLRITLSAAHSEAQVDRLLQCLADVQPLLHGANVTTV